MTPKRAYQISAWASGVGIFVADDYGVIQKKVFDNQEAAEEFRTEVAIARSEGMGKEQFCEMHDGLELVFLPESMEELVDMNNRGIQVGTRYSKGDT
jgi:hypothetical protein